MKIKYNVVVFCLVISCLSYGQRKPNIKGSRVVVEVRENLDFFNAIELNDDLDILLKKSADYGYGLAIDDNLVEVLKFRVVNNILSISSFYKIRSKKKLEITVFCDELNSLLLRDGKIDMEDMIVTDALAVTTYDTAKLNLNANVGFMEVMMFDNSAADLNIEADTLNITVRDRVDANIMAMSKNTTLEMYKSTEVRMEGEAKILNAHLYENASLKAEAFETSEINLTAEATTNAYVNVRDTLNLSSKHSAKVFVYGGGKINVNDFSGASQLSKR